MPKLLLVGVVERTCLKTVIREIPGIADCFAGQPEKDGSVKVRIGLGLPSCVQLMPGLGRLPPTDPTSRDSGSLHQAVKKA